MTIQIPSEKWSAVIEIDSDIDPVIKKEIYKAVEILMDLHGKPIVAQEEIKNKKMIINPNDPAMPHEDLATKVFHGLTIRAEIAARAMQGIYASLGERAITKSIAQQIAQESVQASDSLIAELNKPV